MNLLTQNSKIKKTAKYFNVRLFNFNIPAYNNKVTGKVTCPFAQKEIINDEKVGCGWFCYAKKGFYQFSNTQSTLHEKHLLTLSDNFVDYMYKAIKDKKAEFIRIHDSGDFYSKKYINKWFKIMHELPNVNFYAYTKSHILFNGLDMPENFDMIKSFGGKHDNLINTKKDSFAQLFNTEVEIEKAGFENCSNYDLYATKWFSNNHKKGLKIH